jgi:hypothetical protein
MKKDHVRQHYIPQFILKRFCYDGKNTLWFYDVKSKSISTADKSNVFMERNLYRDITNNKDELEIEKEFSKFEREISDILNKQFYNEKYIYITLEEHEKIKLFYALMGFRSINTIDYYKNNHDEQFEKIFSQYQSDKDFEKLWKRNLKEIVKCRSFTEVSFNYNVDDLIWLLMLNDTTGPFGYIKIVETEKEEFILSDSYPIVEYGPNEKGFDVDYYALYPISSKRAILLIYDGVEKNINFEDSILTKGFFTRPKVVDGKLEFYVKKMKDEQVDYFNQKIKENAKIGIVSLSRKF